MRHFFTFSGKTAICALIALLTPFFISIPASAATIHVPADYSTISAAIAAAIPGDEIIVASGNFYDNLVVDKSLTIVGAGTSLTTIFPAFSAPDPGGSGSLPPGSSNIIIVQADNVEISGFTLDGDNPTLTSGIVFSGADIDARNAIITNHALLIAYNNLHVHDCTVKNIYLRGIYASSGGTFNFHDNLVMNVKATTQSIGIFNFGGAGLIVNNQVSDCNDAISSNHSKGVQYLNNSVANSGSGIHTDNAGDAGGSGDLIQGNFVGNGTASSYGIWCFAPYLAPLIQNNMIQNVHVGLACAGAYVNVTPQFINNYVDNQFTSGSVGAYVTTQIWGFPSGNVSAIFYRNTFFNSTDEIYLEAEAGFTMTLKLSHGLISGTSGSGVVKATGTLGAGTFNVNMTANWWGDPTGPLNATTNPAALGNSIVDGIDYSPWWEGDYRNLDHPWTWHVNGSNLSTIQEGIDSATAGDVVHISSGTYPEQVVIARPGPFTISGAGIGATIIQAPASPMTHFFTTGASNYAIVSVESTFGITISDLTVDGLGKGNINFRLVGIGFYHADGTVNNCEIRDVRNPTLDGTQHGMGVYGYNDVAPVRAVNISGTQVHGFQKGGITLNGAYMIGNVTGCTVTGSGPTSVIAMNGIQLGFGADGNVLDNTVANCCYTGTGATAGGILLYQTHPSVLIKKNHVNDCQVGISLVDGGNTIDSNTIFATPAGTGIPTYWGILAYYTVAAKSATHPSSPFDEEAFADRSKPLVFNTVATHNSFTGGGNNLSTGLEAYVYNTGNLTFQATDNFLTNWGKAMVLFVEPGGVLSSTLQDNSFLFCDVGLDNGGGTASVTHNRFHNILNATDDHSGNFYNQNCWYDYSGVPPYHISGVGTNVDNNPRMHCFGGNCGDANADNIVNISDAVTIVAYIFSGGAAPAPLESADVNCDNTVNISDAVYLIAYIFSGGSAPCAVCM